MPTYDYICRACGHEFELFQQMSDPVKRTCPECGKPKLERLIGAGAGVLFKGGGFYETDYRSDSYTKAAEADKKSADAKSETAKSSDGAVDSKSTKPETKTADGTSEAKSPASGDAGASEKKSSRRSIVKPSSPASRGAKRSKRK